jgi:arylsulfatase A-like enzyme
MFTAQHPRVLGYEDEAVVLDDRFMCLPEILSRGGYKTKGIIAHIYVSRQLGFAQGFDSYDEENAKGHGHISSPSITDKAIAFIDECGEERFFLFAHYFDPHCDYIMHEPFDFYPGYNGPVLSGQPITELRDMAPKMTPDDVRYLNALYDSEIRFTDEHVGELLDHLKEKGLYDDALIVIVADHGEEFLERGSYWIGHTKTVYQELVHVPLMIKLPRMTEGRSVDVPVSLVNIMPTIISLTGLRIPQGYFCDRNALPLADGQDPPSKPIFSETKRWNSMQSLIQDNWKLVYHPETNLSELFDLSKDPRETEDLKEAHADLHLGMIKDLLRWDYDMRTRQGEFERRTPDLTSEQLKRLKSLGYLR